MRDNILDDDLRRRAENIEIKAREIVGPAPEVKMYVLGGVVACGIASTLIGGGEADLFATFAASVFGALAGYLYGNQKLHEHEDRVLQERRRISVEVAQL